MNQGRNAGSDAHGSARKGENAASTREQKGGEEAYFYRDAGIQERRGRVPLWLLFVIIILVIWGAYYMVAYW
jgi:hypothetical protein